MESPQVRFSSSISCIEHAQALLTAEKGIKLTSFIAAMTWTRVCLEVLWSCIWGMLVNWPATHYGMDKLSYSNCFFPFDPWKPSLGHPTSGGADTIS